MAIIGLQKGSGKRSRVREKSVKSQGILIWIMSLMLLHSPVCVGPGRKPRRPVFSERGSHITSAYKDF